MKRAGIPETTFDPGGTTGASDACASVAATRVPAACGEVDPEQAAAEQTTAAIASVVANFRPVVRKASGYCR
jgi:hypothetical protein